MTQFLTTNQVDFQTQFQALLSAKREDSPDVDAIVADTETGSEKWLEMNTKYSEIWPNIIEKKDPPMDHEKYKNEKNKFEKYFKENI